VSVVAALATPNAVTEFDSVATSREPGKLVRGLLSSGEVQTVRDAMAGYPWVRANQSGFVANEQEATGSWRATWYSEDAAKALWARLRDFVGEGPQAFSEGGDVKWRGVGVNPALRLIRYEAGGVVWPHYDAPFMRDYEHQTFLSVVLYLNDTIDDGATRFLDDPWTPDNNYRDWPRSGRDDEVLGVVKAEAGDALIFEHRILHEAPATEGSKIIIRTDIMFEMVE
jgi:hypothetical protein